MIDAGDICVAELRDQRRRQVLVLSNERFHGMSGRVLVAPEIGVGDDEALDPWTIRVGGAGYAVGLMRSLPADRILDRVGRLSSADRSRAQRAVRFITS